MIPQFKNWEKTKGVHPDAIGAAADLFRVAAEMYLRDKQWGEEESMELTGALIGALQFVEDNTQWYRFKNNPEEMKRVCLAFAMVFRRIRADPKTKQDLAVRGACRRTCAHLKAALRTFKRDQSENGFVKATAYMLQARLHFVDIAREMNFPARIEEFENARKRAKGLR